MTVRPAILSGGAGTRLWPLSRQSFPKQFLPIASDRSMLQETALRVSGPGFAPPIVVGGEEHRFFLKRQLDQAGISVETILIEPVGRNTASAAALAAEWLASSGRDELLLLLPSDHVITDVDAFGAAVETGIPYAQDGAIVTFGARPTEPNTQYGYIEGATVASAPDILRIARFVEKPDAQTASEYVLSGNFFWNCGIFLVKASVLIDEMRRFLPESLEAIVSSLAMAERDGPFVRPDAAAFRNAENISIDHGIMEKTDRGLVIPVDMGWSDVGSWSAVWQLSPKDERNTVVQGDVVAIDTSHSLLRNDSGPTITAVGLDHMAVIAVRDAVFVAPMDRVSDVRLIVEEFRKQGRESTVLPAKVARPWGSYETVDKGPRFQIKHIIVDPGETLSLQKHVHRSEHWVVVRGTAEVTIGEEVSLLQENQSTYIPAGTTHRLANPGKLPLELVEVQCGPYLGEDDIVRLSDHYGRS